MNIDFQWKERLQHIEDSFHPFQVIDEQGNIKEPQLFALLSDEMHQALMKKMVWERELDKQCRLLVREGKLGFYAPTEGEEASQMGSMMAIQNDDFLLPGYRDVLQLIVHGLPLYQAFLWSIGHMEGNHYAKDLQALPPQIVVAAHYIQATGIGLALTMEEAPSIAVCYTGDGGSSEGDFYEALNAAADYHAQVLFICNNNRYAISTPRSFQTQAKTLAQKGVATGVASLQVDGMDPVAVYLATKEARQYIISQHVPVFLELLNYRFGPHTLSGDNPSLYRKRDEEDHFRQIEGIKRYRTCLTKNQLWNDDMEKAVIKQTDEQIEVALKQVDKVPPQTMTDCIEHMYTKMPPVIQQEWEKYKGKEEA